jgi:hypothetical protein
MPGNSQWDAASESFQGWQEASAGSLVQEAFTAKGEPLQIKLSQPTFAGLI